GGTAARRSFCFKSAQDAILGPHFFQSQLDFPINFHLQSRISQCLLQNGKSDALFFKSSGASNAGKGFDDISGDPLFSHRQLGNVLIRLSEKK
ncbi:MAG TPA: hypothetical protein VIJ93_04765, partial [bacterium]